MTKLKAKPPQEWDFSSFEPLLTWSNDLTKLPWTKALFAVIQLLDTLHCQLTGLKCHIPMAPGGAEEEVEEVEEVEVDELVNESVAALTLPSIMVHCRPPGERKEDDSSQQTNFDPKVCLFDEIVISCTNNLIVQQMFLL